MITIRNLAKNYRSFPVLRGLNMTINKGDVYGFIGRNGCGKTTTMNIICSILAKDGGEINYSHPDIKIGYLPESPALFEYMNSYEYLDYIAACAEYPADEIKERTAEVLSLVRMSEDGHRRIKGYSRGMVQRLGIAAVIYAKPELIILDEPTSALDPEGRAEVMEIIAKLSASGTTILLCTHILSDIERVANRIGILSDGVMKTEGTIAEIVNSFQQSNSIVVNLFDKNPDNFKLVRMASGVRDSQINPVTGELTLYPTDDLSLEEFSASINKTLAENGISVQSMFMNKPTLEQMYLSIIGSEGGR